MLIDGFRRLIGICWRIWLDLEEWIFRVGYLWERLELAMVGWISGYVKLFCLVMLILFIIFSVFLYCYYLLCVYYIWF